MTTADLLTRAQSALLTNQPNLAMLYMSKASELAVWDVWDSYDAKIHANHKLLRLTRERASR